MRIPIDIELNKEAKYNLESLLKDKGLMSEKGHLIVPATRFISEERNRYKNKETSCLCEEYKDLGLTELQLAILLQLWFLEGELTLQGDIVTLEYYV